jgi:hypothetical protein
VRRALLAAALAVSLAACGSASEPEVATASYTISGGVVTCHNATDTSEYSSGGYHTYDCIWHCVNYDGHSRVYVNLTFLDTAGGWVLDSTYISSGICY